MNHATREPLVLLAMASSVLPLTATASADTFYLGGRMGGRVSLEPTLDWLHPEPEPRTTPRPFSGWL